MDNKANRIMQAAERALAEFHPDDVFGNAVHAVGLKDENDLHSAVNPEFLSRAERRRKLFDEIVAQLPSGEAQIAVQQFDKICEDEILEIKEAWFYVGLIAAKKMLVAFPYGKEE